VDKDNISLGYYLKPGVHLNLYQEKMSYNPPGSFGPALNHRRQPVILLYPPLPYHFLLYFKDRQRAHIELEYNVRQDVGSSFVALRRKVSSGNLEVDLLSMRYIGHYLFTQTAYLPVSGWQTIKIDLEPKKE